jgi:hypothetical protein
MVNLSSSNNNSIDNNNNNKMQLLPLVEKKHRLGTNTSTK